MQQNQQCKHINNSCTVNPRTMGNGSKPGNHFCLIVGSFELKNDAFIAPDWICLVITI